jgi:hypothetical protein
VFIFESLDLLGFPLVTTCADGTKDSSAAANGIRPRLVLGFFLLGDGADLVQVT